MGHRRSIAGLRILITGTLRASAGHSRLWPPSKAQVLATSRNDQLLRELAAEGKNATGRLETLVADVISAQDRQGMIAVMQQHFGGIDVLINNAGIGASGHFAEADEQRARARSSK